MAIAEFVAQHLKASAVLRPEPTKLTEEQRQQFERDGFLVVPGRAAAGDGRAAAAGGRPALRSRACARRAVESEPLGPAQLPPSGRRCSWSWWTGRATFPLVVDLMNWNIHLITSHLVVRAPSPPEADAAWKATGWHRDGGTAASEMQEPHP